MNFIIQVLYNNKWTDFDSTYSASHAIEVCAELIETITEWKFRVLSKRTNKVIFQ